MKFEITTFSREFLVHRKLFQSCMSAVLQLQAPLGSSYATTNSLWPTPRTSSFPSASQFVSFANAPPASNFQSMPTSGFYQDQQPLQCQHPQLQLKHKIHLEYLGFKQVQICLVVVSKPQAAVVAPSKEMQMETFFCSPISKASWGTACKVQIRFAGLWWLIFLGGSSCTIGFVPTTLAPAASQGKSSAVSQRCHLCQCLRVWDLGWVPGPFQVRGRALTPWPQMTPNDVQRYTRVFSKVDTDRDGKITGDQACDLFLSWQLPRGGWLVKFTCWNLLYHVAMSKLPLWRKKTTLICSIVTYWYLATPFQCGCGVNSWQRNNLSLQLVHKLVLWESRTSIYIAWSSLLSLAVCVCGFRGIKSRFGIYLTKMAPVCYQPMNFALLFTLWNTSEKGQTLACNTPIWHSPWWLEPSWCSWRSQNWL